jgi:4'-phosphopantetheinyl transferase
MSLIITKWLQQTEHDVPEKLEWLSPLERDRLAKFRVPKRRSDWLLGRWTAKWALVRYLDLPDRWNSLQNIEVIPAESGAPVAYIAREPANVTISISHRDHVAICAVGTAGIELGCDLEVIEPRTTAFIHDYFTTEEQAFISSKRDEERSFAAALMWSAKESALKALRVGLRADTRSLLVCVGQTEDHELNWSPLIVHLRDARDLQGWWQRSDALLRTVVASQALSPPVEIRLV